jgi:hypothetical protein
MNELLQKKIKKYCLIAIKKLLKANQINDEKVEARQEEIINEIKNQKTLGLEFIEKVETLENEYHDLELKKTIIDFYTLEEKVIGNFKEYYEENLVIETTTKVLSYLRRQEFSLKSFRHYDNVKQKQRYKIKKGSEQLLSNQEKALMVAKVKREKSFNLVKSIYTDLVKNQIKATSNNVYEVIKTNHNDCLKIRQIKTYLKQIKDINCKDITIVNEVLDVIEV